MTQVDRADRNSRTADLVAITEIMSRTLVTARPDDTVETVTARLREHHVGCVPIVDGENRPTGIVTKLDLLECGAASRATAREVMMPLAMTLGAQATIAEAATLMSREGFHHVLIVDQDRALIGVVSTLDLARWLAQPGLIGEG